MKIKVTKIIADAPKRAELRQWKGHSAYYACDLCLGKAASVPMKESNDKTRKRAWPPSTSDSPLRNHNDSLVAANNANWSPDELKGVIGKSLLFDLPGFDIVNDIPVDYMHCVCLGVVKMMVLLSFDVPQRRPSCSREPLIPTHVINQNLKKQKVPSEFSRRTRPLDCSSWKAEEYRNLALFFFPFVLEASGNAKKCKTVWALMSFVTRACCLPENEFFVIPNQYLVKVVRRFYGQFEKCFGIVNCTYNVHLFSHALHTRASSGPFPLVSAFPFEGMFSQMRNCFVPGTPNPTKQIFQQMCGKLCFGHKCEKSITFSEKETEKVNDSYVYIFTGKEHRFFKIKQSGEKYSSAQLVLTGHLEDTANVSPSFDEIELSWSAVGVYRYYTLSEIETNILNENIVGKAIRVSTVILTIPTSCLQET